MCPSKDFIEQFYFVRIRFIVRSITDRQYFLYYGKYFQAVSSRKTESFIFSFRAAATFIMFQFLF